MVINESETQKLFKKKIPKSYLDYLHKRNVVSEEYYSSIENDLFGILCENVIFIEDTPFCVECILGASEVDVYDILRSNELYGLKSETGTAFAVLYGDDFLFFKPNDNKVYYHNRAKDYSVLIAESYNSLIDLIQMEENENE